MFKFKIVLMVVLALAWGFALATGLFAQNASIHVATDEDFDDRYYGLTIDVTSLGAANVAAGFEFGTFKDAGDGFITPFVNFSFSAKVFGVALRPSVILLNEIDLETSEDNFSIGLQAIYSVNSLLGVGARYNEDSDEFIFLASFALK